MKNPVVLVMLFALGAVLLLSIWVSLPKPVVSNPVSSPSKLCINGQTQNCLSAGCDGISTCVNGIWSGCKWKTICTPGSRVPCIKNGCSYAIKECNSCGTDYGLCEPLS